MAHQGVSQSIIRCLFVHFRDVPAVIVCVCLKIQHNLHRRGLTLCSLSLLLFKFIVFALKIPLTVLPVPSFSPH